MNKTELLEIIHNGENSGVEFKRDDIRPEKLAEGMAALLNLEGGYVLLGVENDRTVYSVRAETPQQTQMLEVVECCVVLLRIRH